MENKVEQKESVCLQVKEIEERDGVKKFGVAFKNQDAGYYYAPINDYFEVGKTLTYRIAPAKTPNTNRIYLPIEETAKKGANKPFEGIKSSSKGKSSDEVYKRPEKLRAIGFCLSYAKDKIEDPVQVTKYADELLTWYYQKIDEIYGSTD